MSIPGGECGPDLAEAIVRACLRDFGSARLTVRGGCLSPALAEGTVVRLAPAALLPPRFGDVVLARSALGWRLHRLIWPLAGRSARPRRTKADRSPFLDPPLRRDDLLATVVGVERGNSVRPVRSVGAALRSLAEALLVHAGLLAPDGIALPRAGPPEA